MKMNWPQRIPAGYFMMHLGAFISYKYLNSAGQRSIKLSREVYMYEAEASIFDYCNDAANLD